MSLLLNTTVANDDSFLDQAGNLVTKGLPAMVVSGGVGLANTAISLGNLVGGDFTQYDAQQVTGDLLGKDIQDYYANHETLVEAGGLLLSSIVPGSLAVKAARAGQRGLANAAAREGAGLITRTTSKVLGTGNEINQLTKAIRQGQNSMTAVDNLKFTTFGRSTIQGFYESFAFEAGAILTNNQNAILNPDDLDYISAITSNLDTVAIGTVLGGGIGGLLGGNLAKGQLRSAQREADTALKSLAANKDVTVRGALGGDNLVVTYKEYVNSLAAVPTGGYKSLAEGAGDANAYLKSADHNIRVEMKGQLMEMGGIKGVKFSANEMNGTTLRDVTEDLAEIFADKTIGVDAISQTFGGLKSFGYIPIGKTEAKGGLDAIKQKVTDKFSIRTRSAQAAQGLEETLLERTYYSIRDKRIGDKKKKRIGTDGKFKGWIDPATRKDVAADSYASMVSTIRAEVKRNPEGVTEDMFHSLIAFGNRNDVANLMETSVGKQFVEEATELLQTETKNLIIGLNHKQLSKISAEDLGKMLQEQGNLFNMDTLFQTTVQTMKAGKDLKKFPLLQKFADTKEISERYIENSIYFNTKTRSFTNVPVGATAADYGQITLKGKTLHYAKGELGAGSKFRGEDLVSGKVDTIEATAHWAKAQLTTDANTWRKSAKEAGVLEADDFYSLHNAINSFELFHSGSRGKVSYNDFKVFVKNSSGETIEIGHTAALDLLRTQKQKAFLELSEKNSKDFLWSAEDLRNMLNVTDDFILRQGVPTARNDLAHFLTQNNYMKTQNIRMDYAAQDLERNFAIGKGMLEVERRLAARRKDIGLTTQSYLDRRGAQNMAVPNKLQRDADFTPADSVTRGSVTQGFVNSQQADTMGEAFFQGISKVTSLLRQNAIDTTSRAMANIGKNLKGDQAALAELSVVNSKLAQGNYGIMKGAEVKEWQATLDGFFDDLVDVNKSYLVPSDFIASVRNGDIDPATLMDTFNFAGRRQTVTAIENKNVSNFLEQYGNLNSSYVRDRNLLNRHNGDSYDWNEFTLPAIAPKLTDLPEMATVTFPAGRKYGDAGQGYIFARNQKELTDKIAVLQKNNPDAEVHRISQVEADARRLEGIDLNRAITSNSTNVDMRKHGLFWDVLPEPSAGMVDRFMDVTTTNRIKLDRQYVREHYIEDFRALEMEDAALGVQSKQSKNAGKSTELSPQRKLLNAALGIQNQAEYRTYRGLQEKAAELINNAAATFSGHMVKVESAYRTKDIKAIDNAWEEVNKYASHHGLPLVYRGAEDYIMSTSKVGRDVASATVSKMNAFTSWLMLRADQIQGMVNAFSTPITLMPAIKELRHMIGAEGIEGIIKSKTGVKVPGTEISFSSDFKLMMNSFKRALTDKEAIKRMTEQGHITRDFQQLLDATEEFSAVAATMEASKINGFFGKLGSKLTFLSDKSEELVRLTAALAADDIITDAIKVASPANAAKLEGMRFSLINSVVTKTHGNYVAAQRPTLFQGFGGQALGLFQTYQFNLIQMLARNVQQGELANAMRMVGLQGSIFGAQSIPGFQFINEHIGEKTHGRTDLYAEANQNLGKELSDFILYGAASAITLPLGTGTNFYTRGDLTPRTPILVPTSIGEMPLVNFLTKFVNATSAAYQQAGVDMSPNVLWQFLAHQGYSRPLSGVGQLMLGGKTTLQGTTVLDFDELDVRSLHTAVKLMGTQTTEESIALNAFYRSKSYQSSRQAELNRIGMGARVALQNGRAVDTTAIMSQYLQSGGDGANFDRWYQNQVQHAGESELSRMRANMTSPEGKYLQAILD